MFTSKFTTDGIEYTINHNSDWSGPILVSWTYAGKTQETRLPGELVLSIGRRAASNQIISILETWAADERSKSKLTATVTVEPPKPSDSSTPIAMLLFCPFCHFRHVDQGEFFTKPHHTHACQGPGCGMVWRPALVPTVGVEYLPGFKDHP
jgi:hypothetical protein